MGEEEGGNNVGVREGDEGIGRGCEGGGSE